MDSRLATRGSQISSSLRRREAIDQIIQGLLQLRDSLDTGVELERVADQEAPRPYLFERARDNLIRAQEHYKNAVNALLTTRGQLESKRAALLVEGVEGKNAETRDASIRLQLQDDYAELERREAALNEARAELDIARLEWDTLRYQVRLLGVSSSYE
jgi:hypothetical protein